MNGLDNFRQQIDQIDHKILQLLAERFSVVKEIGMYKKAHGLPPLDQTRRQTQLNDWTKKGKELGLDKKFVKELYLSIHDSSVEKEELL